MPSAIARIRSCPAMLRRSAASSTSQRGSMIFGLVLRVAHVEPAFKLSNVHSPGVAFTTTNQSTT